MNATTPPQATRSTIDVWFDAEMQCTNGNVGTVQGLVCSAVAPHLHDVVVRDHRRPHDDHPIARHHIATADRRVLAVDMSTDDVGECPLPTRTVMVTENPMWLSASLPDEPGVWLPYDGPLQVPVTVAELQPGDVLIRAHAAVYVGDHHVGRLSGVQVDMSNGKVTAAIVDVGHVWHHRHVLVPADEIEELAESIVWVRGPRAHIRHLPDAGADRHDHGTLIPAEPHDLGVDDHDPDAAHLEAAHVLADEAHARLRERGFTDSEIRHWADAYVDQEHSGDAEAFVEWIETQEQRRASTHAPVPRNGLDDIGCRS